MLLLAALVPYLLVVSFWLERHSLREAMEKKLMETNLVQINIAKGNFTWVKAGKEIQFNNRLFDVHSFEQQNDSIVFKGLFDEDEKKLIQNFEHLQQKTHKLSRNQLAVSLFHFMGNAKPAPPSFTYIFIVASDAKQWKMFMEPGLHLGYMSLPFKPPCSWPFATC